MLRKLAEPAGAFVSLETAKQRCNILHDDWDRDIEFLIRAAGNAFERETGVALLPTTYEYRADCWGGLALPRTPVRAVASVSYVDDAGTVQSVDSGNWYFDLTGGGAQIGYLTSWSPPWPLQIYRPGRIRVVFSAGYDDPEHVSSDSSFTRPPEAELALLFIVGAWLEHREAVMAEQRYEVPMAFKYLASQLKVYQ